MKDELWATVIKVAAVAVAAPRWIGALLEAEGVPLPPEWRGMSGRSANIMALMIGGSAVTFVIVLSPYIAANVSKISMSKLLIDGWPLAWSVAVALPTILIIASVGYAQTRPAATRTPNADCAGRATATTTAAGNANETRTDANGARMAATREEFITAWRANGHTSIAALAQELGFKPRTAQKWVNADEATTSKMKEVMP